MNYPLWKRTNPFLCESNQERLTKVEQGTKGIVFQAIKYKDNQIIARIYTEKFGLKAFIIRVGKTNKSIILPIIQPFNLVDIEVRIKENSSIQQIKSIRLATPFIEIPFDPIKSTIVLFLNEIVNKTVAEDYHNDELFTFLEYGLLTLDQTSHPANFHLWFLFELTRQYGFYPAIDDESDPYFDLMQGQSTSMRPAHPHYLEGQAYRTWQTLADKRWPEIERLAFSGEERSGMLEHLVRYMQLHLDNTKEIRSLAVLKETFQR